MKILALEFSSPQRSVAVLSRAAGSVAEVVNAGAGHTTKPFAMIESALRQAGLEREQIECVGVGLGPGSYHGIRAAIALAQGWRLARPVKLVGISSVECVAAQAAVAGLSGRFNVVMDAQRGEFYVAGYEAGGGIAREVASLRIATADAIREREQTGEMMVGPEAIRWFPGGQQLWPRAAVLAQLASGRKDYVEGEKLAPIYLRETTFVKAPPPRVISSLPTP